MNELIIGNTKIEYSKRESIKAKKLKFVITPHNVELVIPATAETNRIYEFIEKKKNWVFLKLNEVNEKVASHLSGKPYKYQSGAKILYRGRMLKLLVADSKSGESKVSYKNGFHVQVTEGLTPSEKYQSAKDILDKWMKERVRKDVKGFINIYSKKLNLFPKDFRVKDQKHLWGSCGKDNIININWRLIQAPKQILEYVVVHEICHLKYRNHSDAFWSLVGSVFPEVDRCKRLLRDKEEWEL
ncbi:MAG: M48 family metallopeptidase [Spirochaetaceae bacterium]|nr:M48 family metallopeptidase [Spirochaetaceae bacterium]